LSFKNLALDIFGSLCFARVLHKNNADKHDNNNNNNNNNEQQQQQEQQ